MTDDNEDNVAGWEDCGSGFRGVGKTIGGITLNTSRIIFCNFSLSRQPLHYKTMKKICKSEEHL